MHAHALETLSNATILVNGGIAANLDSPRILRLTLVPGAKTDGEKPADPFRLFEVSIEHKDDMRPFVSSWEYIEAECDRKTRFFQEEAPGRCRPRLHPRRIRRPWHPYRDLPLLPCVRS